MCQISAGESVNLNAYFDGASGEIQSITIDNLYLLTSTGLPEKTSGGDSVSILFGETNENEPDPQTDVQNETDTTTNVKEGSTTYQGLEIKAFASSPQVIKVEYINNTANGFSLGWVNGPTITCTTTDGEFYFSPSMGQLSAGDSGSDNYYFDTATGDLLSVTISGINVLSQQGLPSDFSGGGSATIEFN